MSHTWKTTRWCCFLRKICNVNNSRILCRTFINFISTHEGIIAAPPHVGHAHFRLDFFPATARKLQNTTIYGSMGSNYAPFSDSHETSQVASPDCPMKKSNWKYFDISFMLYLQIVGYSRICRPKGLIDIQAYCSYSWQNILSQLLSYAALVV